MLFVDRYCWDEADRVNHSVTDVYIEIRTVCVLSSELSSSNPIVTELMSNKHIEQLYEFDSKPITQLGVTKKTSKKHKTSKI